MRSMSVGAAPWSTGLVVAAAAAGVVALADAATEHDGPASYDPSFARDVTGHRTTFLTHLANASSFVGSEGSIAALALVVLVVLARRRRFREAIVLGVGMAGAAAFVVALKHVVDRARPGAVFRLGGPDGSPSFPSGHTLMTAMFMGLLVWLAWPHVRRLGDRVAMVAGAGLVALVVGASRVYLGYHWTTDVVAAWLVAGAWLGILLLLAPVALESERLPWRIGGVRRGEGSGALASVGRRRTSSG